MNGRPNESIRLAGIHGGDGHRAVVAAVRNVLATGGRAQGLEYAKFQAWADNHDRPEDALSMDATLDDLTLYWLTDSAASSARFHLENVEPGPSFPRLAHGQSRLLAARIDVVEVPVLGLIGIVQIRSATRRRSARTLPDSHAPFRRRVFRCFPSLRILAP